MELRHVPWKVGGYGNMLPRPHHFAEHGPDVPEARSTPPLGEGRGLVSMLVLGMRAIAGGRVKFQDVFSHHGPSEL